MRKVGDQQGGAERCGLAAGREAVVVVEFARTVLDDLREKIMPSNA